MARLAIRVFVIFAVTLSATCAAVGQAAVVVSRIQMLGNRRVNRDTALSLTHTRVGDPYNPKVLLDDVEILQHSKYFEGVLLGIEDDPAYPKGKVVSFHLRERPVINHIEYNGLDSVTPSEIAERLRARNVDLSVGGFFNPEALAAAQAVISEILTEHGHPSVQVKFSFQSIPSENAVNLSFTVDAPPTSH